MDFCPDISKVTVERTLTDLVKKGYIWTNEYYREKLFIGKRKYKIKEYRWLMKEDHENLLFVDDINDTTTYKTDEELMADINPIGVNIYSIRHGKKLYRNPKVVFMYVNGDKRTYYFDNNSDDENTEVTKTNFKACKDLSKECFEEIIS